MLNQLRLLLIILFCSALTQAQLPCDSTIFRYTGKLIRDATLFDTENIIAIGASGNLMKSPDGGLSWKQLQTPIPNSLASIHFASDSIGYAIGSYKTVLKSEDQGNTWFPLLVNLPLTFSNASSSFNDMFFFNRNRGVIVGQDGMIIRTADGGKSWTSSNQGFYASFASVSFLNDSTGFICGSAGIVAKTQDGGKSWSEITIPGIDAFKTLRKVKFLNDSTGFLLGASGLFFRTADGGRTWTKLDLPYNDYGDIYFIDSLKGFVAGGGGVFMTTDAGLTWKASPDFPVASNSIFSINASPGSKKILFAGNNFSYRHTVSTIDSGATFTVLNRNPMGALNDVTFINDSTGYMSGEGGGYTTKDYGESWTQMGAIPSNFSYNEVQTMYFVDSLHGFAASNALSKTSDGGKTWTRITTTSEMRFGALVKMYFADTLNGLFRTIDGVFKTTDGGMSWKYMMAPPMFISRDMTVAPDGKIYLVGYNGDMRVSSDFGSTWTPYDLHSRSYLTSVYFYNAKLGFIGTSDSAIYKTIDGGANWTRINVKIYNMQIRSFFFLSESIGYAIGNNDGGISWIYQTKDGGISWTLIRSESRNLSRFSGFRTFYTVGTGDGLILRSENLLTPPMPGYIYGPDSSCLNTTSNFITSPMSGATFNWTLDGGGSSRSNLNSDTVTWSTFGLHTLSVTASNVCGMSAPRSISVLVGTYLPIIAVKDSVLTASEGAAYQWFRNGITIPYYAGGTTRSYVARQAGVYTVTVTNKFSCMATTEPYVYTVALPLELLSFKAVLSGNGVAELTWSTARENGVKYFVVERKGQDGNFQPVATVVAKNLNSTSQNYFIADPRVPVGLNFYRLRIVDVDGVITYSTIELVRSEPIGQPVIYPNPVQSSTITIRAGSSRIFGIRIFDTQLRPIKAITYKEGESIVSVPIGAVDNGVYIVEIQTAGGSVRQKISVNR
jgi:photosystem II stability/assembly factor-like uncharacterized protein